VVVTEDETRVERCLSAQRDMQQHSRDFYDGVEIPEWWTPEGVRRHLKADR
jgi:hypothetical protein